MQHGWQLWRFENGTWAQEASREPIPGAVDDEPQLYAGTEAILRIGGDFWLRAADTWSAIPDSLEIGAVAAARSLGGGRLLAAWIQRPGSSDAPAGVSNSPAPSTSPTVGFIDGDVCVAWAEAADQEPVVTVRCHR